MRKILAVICGFIFCVLTLAQTAPQPRTLEFSGYEWVVKSSTGPVGPGPNWFSGTQDDVWVDTRGELHMRIRERDGQWWCTELISKRSFGYGTYRFHLGSTIDTLAPNIVLGLFTWSNDPAEDHREIDIEVSRWGKEGDNNAQFVLQPHDVPGNRLRFMMRDGLQASVHSFTWLRDRLSWISATGDTGGTICSYTLWNRSPNPGDENARINFWLMGGTPPADGKDAEVILRRFEFAAAR